MISNYQHLAVTVMRLDRVDPFPNETGKIYHSLWKASILLYWGKCFFREGSRTGKGKGKEHIWGKKKGSSICLNLYPWPRGMLLWIPPHFLPQEWIINHDRPTTKKDNPKKPKTKPDLCSKWWLSNTKFSYECKLPTPLFYINKFSVPS